MRKIFSLILMLVMAVGAVSAADGFYTSGTKLMDANGNEFVMRGCNYSYAWQTGNEYSVIPAAKRIGCNSIRIQLSTGRKWSKTSRSAVERLIRLCEENKLIVIFNTHDETGSNDYGDLENACNYWLEIKDLLNAHRKTVLVNISNEWCGDWNSGLWADGYLKAIPKLRDGGLLNTLVVDCGGYGQYPKSLFDRGRDVARADRLNNLVFSIHMYQDAGKDEYTVKNNIDRGLQLGVPLIIGEFAYRHQGHDVAWQTILDYTKEKNVGYLVWSWTGNGNGAEDCDMFGGYDDSYYKPNGTNTVKGRNGIKATSRECGYYSGQQGGGQQGGGDQPGDFRETTVDTPDYNVADWNTTEYHLTKEKLGTVGSSDIVRLYVETNSGAEVQVAYKDAAYNWTEYIAYAPISAPVYELRMEDQALRDGANTDGLYFKGHDYTIKKVTVVRPGNSGIDSADSALSAPTIDFDSPYEIYTLDGRRVVGMLPGHIYILRQGTTVLKYLRR